MPGVTIPALATNKEKTDEEIADNVQIAITAIRIFLENLIVLRNQTVIIP